jgi:protease II
MMKTDLSSGHFNASDRYKDLRERAFEMSFVLSQISQAS